MLRPEKQYRNQFVAALAGTVVVALCCFTPMLVLLLGVIGLGAMTPYLDFVLLPVLAVLIFLAVRSYRKWKKLNA